MPKTPQWLTTTTTTLLIPKLALLYCITIQYYTSIVHPQHVYMVSLELSLTKAVYILFDPVSSFTILCQLYSAFKLSNPTHIKFCHIYFKIYLFLPTRRYDYLKTLKIKQKLISLKLKWKSFSSNSCYSRRRPFCTMQYVAHIVIFQCCIITR